MVRVWGGCAFEGKVEGAKERRIKLFMLFLCVWKGGVVIVASPTKQNTNGGEREGVKFAIKASVCKEKRYILNRLLICTRRVYRVSKRDRHRIL